MRLISILFIILFIVSTSYAQIHYWVDEKGIQHYSCDPPPNKNAVKDYQVFATFDDAPGRINKSNTQANSKSTKAPSNSNAEYPEIIMYTTSWCGVCKKAKAWLNAHHITYYDYDVEKIPAARTEYNNLGGGGVPLIVVGNHRINGWSEAWMKRRLGMD